MKSKKLPYKIIKNPKNWPTEEQWAEAERLFFAKSRGPKFLGDLTPIEQAKHDICAHFVCYYLDANITQREMAARLDVAESRVSEIIHYEYKRFTLDKLFELLLRIRPEMKLKVA